MWCSHCSQLRRVIVRVEESQLRLFPHRDRERLTAQLILDVVELHMGSLGHLELTCLSTIPGFLGPEQSEYADRKTSSVTVNIEVPLSSSHAESCWTVLLMGSLFILLR
ncbi:uncharacterized protein LOC111863031 isoform X2 [Cryptotermes secundus]|uniref:uncharacterized protein LOC111863031 isoform X2 n=1 Tax=Cryptotermes secundus TaxID=105785 RepID=UPI000CD7D497|nr:uncharacterized protein LOC111863031 isoform X2 [Cryptotermes secundus]